MSKSRHEIFTKGKFLKVYSILVTSVYLASSSTLVEHDVWMINSSSYFQMNTHRELFSEHEKYNGGDVFLGDDSTSRITGHGKDKLLLKDGRIRTFYRFFHIPKFNKKLKSISNMSDVGVYTLFERETYKMV
jgi:hypothetical protein